MSHPEIDEEETGRQVARQMSAQDVLDIHADLQRQLAHPEPRFAERLMQYARADVEGHPEWTASHLHPARNWNDLRPWLASLGTDLFGARTYQVTTEMVELAEKLEPATPHLSELPEEDLPYPWGFIWLDKPIPSLAVDDNGRLPLLMHAVSWAVVPQLDVDIRITDEETSARGARDALLLPDGVATVHMSAVRIRKWGYNADMRIEPRPLYLMGQHTIPTQLGIQTTLDDIRLLHMIWIMIGMEIVTSDPEMPGRQGRKRAANLRFQQTHVVRLRRARHGEPEGGHRAVDWSCSWLVRGHWRKAPHGTFKDGRTRTWVKPHIKGPDGAPLRASDLLYRLQR